MARTKVGPRGGLPSATHSIRVPDAVWRAAQTRAKGEGKSMSATAALLFEAYGQGLLDLPREQRVLTAAGQDGTRTRTTSA